MSCFAFFDNFAHGFLLNLFIKKQMNNHFASLVFCMLLITHPGASYPSFSQHGKKAAVQNNSCQYKTCRKSGVAIFRNKKWRCNFRLRCVRQWELYLHQTCIPAINGNTGFAGTTSAGSTARLTIKKMRQGEIHPTITLSELKKLKIITP